MPRVCVAPDGWRLCSPERGRGLSGLHLMRREGGSKVRCGDKGSNLCTTDVPNLTKSASHREGDSDGSQGGKGEGGMEWERGGYNGARWRCRHRPHTLLHVVRVAGRAGKGRHDACLRWMKIACGCFAWVGWERECAAAEGPRSHPDPSPRLPGTTRMTHIPPC